MQYSNCSGLKPNEQEPDIMDSSMFELAWESQAEKDLYWRLTEAIGVAAAKGVLAVAIGGTTQLGAAMLASSTIMEHKPISSLFKMAKGNAKLAG